jgi:uncharacterized protein (DUF2132 family)
VEEIKKYNKYMDKVKLNQEAVGAQDVEETVVNTLKQWYGWENRSTTIAVQC